MANVSRIINIEGMQYWEGSLGAQEAARRAAVPAMTATPSAGGGLGLSGGEALFAKLAGAIGSVNTALNTMASVIKTQTTQALIAESKARGELSKALETQAKFSAAAEFARGVPLIGGAAGNILQAIHEQRQQQLGTRHVAAAMGMLEARIPAMQGTRQAQGIQIAGGQLRQRYAADPAQEAFQQQMLSIRTGEAAQHLAGLRGGREIWGQEIGRRQAALEAAEQLPRRRQTTGVIVAEPTRPEVVIARERLRQAQQARSAYDTPTVRGEESALQGQLRILEQQAGQDFLRARSLQMAPMAGLSIASFARGQAMPTTAPEADPTTAIVNLDASIKSLTAAIDGVNPTTKGK